MIAGLRDPFRGGDSRIEPLRIDVDPHGVVSPVGLRERRHQQRGARGGAGERGRIGLGRDVLDEVA